MATSVDEREARVGPPPAFRLGAVHVDGLGDRPAQADADLGQPDRVDVGAEQVLVEQVEARRGDDARDHLVGVAEVVLVVAVAGGAVRGDQGRLAGSSGSPRALGVVRGRGRHVAHGNGVEAGDIDAKLHRRRAVQQLQLPVAEFVLALAAHFGVDLGGVLTGHQPGQRLRDLPVQPDEVRVGPRRCGAAERTGKGVIAAARTVAGPPYERGRADPVAARTAPPEVLGLGEQAGPVAGQHPQQVADDLLRVVAADRPQVAGETAGPLEVAAELAPPGHEDQVPGGAGPPGAGVDDRRVSLVAVADGPLRAQRLLAAPLHAVELVRLEALGVDRQGPAHLVEQHPADPLADFRRGVPQGGEAVPPQLVPGRDAFQAQVADLDQSDLLQVGHGDPPAALQVEEHPQVHHVAQRGFRAPAQRRVFPGVRGVVVRGEAERAGDLGRDVVVEQALLAVCPPP